MRAIWKGAITFGLVNIPVALYPATKREQLSFRMLRKSDLSPINFKRVAAADGKVVAWDDIVKGYEYQKDKYVVLTDEDFKRVDIEATQTVDVIDFVDLDQVNPMLFQKPYYLEPQKGGIPAYRLLRGVLENSGKIGITKVVIKTRQHLAALKVHGSLLVLELMYFGDELADPDDLKIPSGGRSPSAREVQMARSLVKELSVDWDPDRYTDDYSSALMSLIKEKVKHGGKTAAKAPKKRTSGKVIDLVAVLEESLRQSKSGGGTSSGSPKKKAKTTRRKTTAKKKTKAKTKNKKAA